MHIDGHRFVWEFYTNRKDQKQNVTILSEVKSWMQMQLQRTNVHLFVQYYCISQILYKFCLKLPTPIWVVE